MTGVSYATSAEMAKELGPFPGYAENREHMLRVVRNHRRAAHGKGRGYEGLSILPVVLDAADVPFTGLADAAAAAWDAARAQGELHGSRNSPASVNPPTGPLGLPMDLHT